MARPRGRTQDQRPGGRRPPRAGAEPTWDAAPEWALQDGRLARVRFTSSDDGDLTQIGPTDVLRARRRAVADGHARWTWLRQVHGSTVVRVTSPGEHAGHEADAAVTTVSGAPLAVRTADCAGVALVAPAGVIGVAHAGWRGLAAGVLEATVDAMRDLGAQDIEAAVGPLIHPECYEFGADDLDAVAARLGERVRGRTEDGEPALDLPGGVQTVLRRLGVELPAGTGPCTAHDDRWFSHRARRDPERQAVVAWIQDR